MIKKLYREHLRQRVKRVGEKMGPLAPYFQEVHVGQHN